MNISNLISIAYWTRLWDERADVVVVAATKIAVILLAYFVIRFVAARLIGRLSNSLLTRVSGDLFKARQARLGALQSVLGSAVAFVLGFIALVMVLQAAGINIVPLITTASVAGLAVGFGAQKLVRDVIAGIFILIEDQYGVQDYVTIGAVTGTVDELGMRTTRIRDRAGKLYIISNGDISQVCNHSRGGLLVTRDVAVPVSSDLSKARRVLEELGRSLADDMPLKFSEPCVSDGLVQLSGATATLRLVGHVAPAAEEEVQMQLNARIREAFESSGLQLA